MIETLHLLPPDLGPRSNPMLFGVAEAIAALLPPVSAITWTSEDDMRDAGATEAGVVTAVDTAVS